MLPDIVFGEWSQRYDSTDAALREAVRTLVERCGIVVLTEVSSEHRERVVVEVCNEDGRQFGHVTGDRTGADDAAVLWDADRFQMVDAGTTLMSTVTALRKNRKPWSPAACAWAVLEDTEAGNRRLLVTGAHLPASVEGRGRLLTALNTGRAWRAQRAAWQRTWNQLAAEHKVHAVVVAGDWNLDWRRAWVRRLITSLQRKMKPIWGSANLPAVGTHVGKDGKGRRIIDLGFIRGQLWRVTRPTILPGIETIDHRGWWVTLRWAR